MKTEKILTLLFSVQFFVENVDEVNANLEEICVKEGIPIITYSNINPKRHLNESRLHINYAGGISVLARNFKDFLTNSDWQEYEDNVSDNSHFVIGDSVSSNDFNRMKTKKD